MDDATVATMMTLAGHIHELYETAEGDMPATRINFVHSGAFLEGMEYAIYTGTAVDCDKDEVPFVIQWFKSDHFEVCQLFNGAAHHVLWSSGSVVTHELSDDHG
jgi:hypothetical protein